MVIYILTKFDADWLIFVDARVLTRKLWVDGRTDGQRWTVSDHNSSLSPPYSGELKKIDITHTSNFSFPLIVFKRLVLQTRKNRGLFEKGLKGFPFRVIKTPDCVVRS